MNSVRTATGFLVWLARDEDGRLLGIVERVRTGRKNRFIGIDDIGRAIADLLGDAPLEAPTGPDTTRRET